MNYFVLIEAPEDVIKDIATRGLPVFFETGNKVHNNKIEVMIGTTNLNALSDIANKIPSFEVVYAEEDHYVHLKHDPNKPNTHENISFDITKDRPINSSDGIND